MNNWFKQSGRSYDSIQRSHPLPVIPESRGRGQDEESNISGSQVMQWEDGNQQERQEQGLRMVDGLSNRRNFQWSEQDEQENQTYSKLLKKKTQQAGDEEEQDESTYSKMLKQKKAKEGAERKSYGTGCFDKSSSEDDSNKQAVPRTNQPHIAFIRETSYNQPKTSQRQALYKVDPPKNNPYAYDMAYAGYNQPNKDSKSSSSLEPSSLKNSTVSLKQAGSSSQTSSDLFDRAVSNYPELYQGISFARNHSLSSSSRRSSSNSFERQPRKSLRGFYQQSPEDSVSEIKKNPYNQQQRQSSSEENSSSHVELKKQYGYTQRQITKQIKQPELQKMQSGSYINSSNMRQIDRSYILPSIGGMTIGSLETSSRFKRPPNGKSHSNTGRSELNLSSLMASAGDSGRQVLATGRSHLDTGRSGLATGRSMLTTGRRNIHRQFIVSVIQYCSGEVGLAMYNTVNGQIYLCQIIQRLTYIRTISTIQRFAPIEIIYSSSLQHMPLIRKLQNEMRGVTFRSFKRMMFDQTKGYNIYSQRSNNKEYNPDQKFIAYAALNALVFYIQNVLEAKLAYSSLKMRWHQLQGLLVIQPQTIRQLQIFLNSDTNRPNHCFVNNFSCVTGGGSRMLRGNLLQPLSTLPPIQQRQQFLKVLLDNTVLFTILKQQLGKFRNFQRITAKFIQIPKSSNIKSLKQYLGAVHSLSRMCHALNHLKLKLEPFQDQNCSIISRFLRAARDTRVDQLRQAIQDNFEQSMLRSYQQGQSPKKQNFMFLLRADKMQCEYIEVMRITYSHTVEDIINLFKTFKEKSGVDMRLLNNETRGYYIRLPRDADMGAVSQRIQDDVIKLGQSRDSLHITTNMLSSLNNRLKQGQKRVILQSQKLLLSVIEGIQTKMQVLFDINYEMAMIDMMLAFAGWVRKNAMISFVCPTITKGSNSIKIEGMRTVWTHENNMRLSEAVDLQLPSNKSMKIYQKATNAYKQISLLYGVGYATILTQVGCFVPAKSIEIDLYSTLLSKIKLRQSIQSNLSRFQLECHHFKAILENSSHHDRCLILLDELIKGTQYHQQLALSMAMVSSLAKQSQNKVFVLLGDRHQVQIIEKMASRQYNLYPQLKDKQKQQDRPVNRMPMGDQAMTRSYDQGRLQKDHNDTITTKGSRRNINLGPSQQNIFKKSGVNSRREGEAQQKEWKSPISIEWSNQRKSLAQVMKNLNFPQELTSMFRPNGSSRILQ